MYYLPLSGSHKSIESVHKTYLNLQKLTRENQDRLRIVEADVTSNTELINNHHYRELVAIAKQRDGAQMRKLRKKLKYGTEKCAKSWNKDQLENAIEVTRIVVKPYKLRVYITYKDRKTRTHTMTMYLHCTNHLDVMNLKGKVKHFILDTER